ncbi:glucose 1-dehydrogenase [Haloquadratum walsbyi]|uniref:Glucose 1-dehydrogenase n=1 Tax=Haloquadratum walsbyi J07HQW2 TaxID=1238425 RepID=U1PSB3_9EURY|nr:glucose 1-dehydrogenase [Haloquadratum walsbyi]ERG96687.1 MAG: threonine dehydrogenase related Zn-dependent dehydrogenase [Haloquadratum walsbyi J07HQW2]
MQAIAVSRDSEGPICIEKPRPEPEPGEALVRTLRVGIDGTDHEILAGSYGEYPDGEDHLILGHEAVGVVEDPGTTDFERGEVVAPIVRRPPDGGSVYFDRGEPDMAPEESYYERGIIGSHGYFSEFFTSQAQYLVSVPPSLARVGFLIEPLSVVNKAIELAMTSRSSFNWEPTSALVLGNGSLGLLMLAHLTSTDTYERCYCLGRRDRPDPTIDIIERLGATYIDSRKTPVDTIPSAYESMDFVCEATGHAPHAFKTIDALAPNGVGALLGVPESSTFEIDGGALHNELVLHNKALIGSVNSNADHFETATDDLRTFPEWFIDALITDVYPLSNFIDAFDDDDTTIKTAVQLSAYEER